MTINIEYETDQELGIDYAALASQVADKVLEMENCPYDGQVNLVLTDNEEIKRVNTEFRNIQAPTDVLSFPMIPFETPADYSVVEEDESYFDLDSDELLLGDIMISVPKVFAQAEEYGHSVTREFCFLVAHSMLHLLGYDHMTEEEAKVMEAKQAAALKELGINSKSYIRLKEVIYEKNRYSGRYHGNMYVHGPDSPGIWGTAGSGRFCSERGESDGNPGKELSYR